VVSYKLQEYLSALQTVVALGPLFGARSGIVESLRLDPSTRVIATIEADTTSTAYLETLPKGSAGDGTLAPADKPLAIQRQSLKSSPTHRKQRVRKILSEASDDGHRADELPGEPKRAYTIEEASQRYSISRSTLYKLIDSKILPDLKPEHCRRLIPHDALEELIAGRRR
jgi:excisionase family DNA binding protein